MYRKFRGVLACAVCVLYAPSGVRIRCQSAAPAPSLQVNALPTGYDVYLIGDVPAHLTKGVSHHFYTLIRGWILFVVEIFIAVPELS